MSRRLFVKIEKILVEENFKKWIEDAQDSKVIGYSKLPRACPISTYLTETQPKITFVSSGPQKIYLKTGKSPKAKHFDLETPKWASKIIDLVDAQEVIFGSPITKAEFVSLAKPE